MPDLVLTDPICRNERKPAEPPTASSHLSTLPHTFKALVEADGIEPTTPCLQSRCSPTELRPLALPAHDVPQHTRGPGGPGKI
jgi:hypothetical protein